MDALDRRVTPVPASLVLISPAVGIHPIAALAVWTQRLSMLPGLGHLGWLVVEPEFDPYKYNSFATNAGVQVHRLPRSVHRRTPVVAPGTSFANRRVQSRRTSRAASTR